VEKREERRKEERKRREREKVKKEREEKREERERRKEKEREMASCTPLTILIPLLIFLLAGIGITIEGYVDTFRFKWSCTVSKLDDVVCLYDGFPGHTFAATISIDNNKVNGIRVTCDDNDENCANCLRSYSVGAILTCCNNTFYTSASKEGCVLGTKISYWIGIVITVIFALLLLTATTTACYAYGNSQLYTETTPLNIQ
jgi:hypothetical protein